MIRGYVLGYLDENIEIFMVDMCVDILILHVVMCGGFGEFMGY